MKIRGSARGQTLVLFALTTLLLTLLVLMTLSISTRVKEKMELQAVADAAAYSNAVVTARAYNEIALMSRAQIGKMVSLAAVQSLISWSSYYLAQVQATIMSYANLEGQYAALAAACCATGATCPQFCACATSAVTTIGLTITQLLTYRGTLQATYQGAEPGAAMQSQLIQLAASAIYGFQVERWARIRDKLGDQEVAKDIVNRARVNSKWPDEWEAPDAAGEVSLEEAAGLTDGASLINNLGNNQHHVYAAMGSRGHSFVVSRSGGADALSTMLSLNAGPPDIVRATNRGSSYFAALPNHGGLFPRSMVSWAEDHGDDPSLVNGTNTVTFNRAPGCPSFTGMTGGVFSMLRSTDSTDSTDFHVYGTLPLLLADPPQVHTLGPCFIPLLCPDIWPMFVDYNPVQLLSGRDNNQGQPKNYATIVRDYSKRLSSPDPWALFFRFDFTGGSDSQDSEFDGRGIKLSPQNGNLDISRQVALSTGLTYYHRYGHWKEPPNLLNPYWRATLVPWDVDEDGEDEDAAETLDRAGASWARESFEALKRRGGYRGGP